MESEAQYLYFFSSVYLLLNLTAYSIHVDCLVVQQVSKIFNEHSTYAVKCTNSYVSLMYCTKCKILFTKLEI